jgi:hypothetical protein
MIEDANHPDGGYCGYPCPEGQSRITLGNSQSSCVELLDDEPCQNVLGQFNGMDICADDSDECSAQNGSFGIVDFGSGEQAVCIPNNLSPPTCDPGELLLVTDAGGGGFACTPPTGDNCEEGQVIVDGRCEEPPDEPEDCTPGQVFKDGSCVDTSCPTGTVQVNGQCIDDGCPEGQTLQGGICMSGTEGECESGSTLQGGSCVPDTGPGDPIEGETKEPGTASGGAQCNQAPTCKGDAIECAVLFQQWKARCAVENLADDLTEPFDSSGIISEFQSLLDGNGPSDILDGLDLENTEGIGAASQSGLQGLVDKIGSIFTGNLNTCGDYSVTFPWASFTITCADTQPLRDIFYWVFSVLTVIAVVQIALRPPASPVT